MAHVQFDVAEARRRMEIVSKLPENPMRKRELAALQRALEMAATMPTPKKRAQASRRKAAELATDAGLDEPAETPRPRRQIEQTPEGKKRVIVRKVAPPRREPLIDAGREDRERRQRLSDIQTTLGLTHRGMS